MDEEEDDESEDDGNELMDADDRQIIDRILQKLQIHISGGSCFEQGRH